MSGQTTRLITHILHHPAAPKGTEYLVTILIVYSPRQTISMVCGKGTPISIDYVAGEVVNVSEIARLVGQRLRSYRLQLGLSQERVAELSGCHPTYIGQVERGEKNATIESIAKIASAIDVPLSTLFEKIDGKTAPGENIASICYELLLGKSKSEQEQIYRIILELDKYIDMHM